MSPHALALNLRYFSAQVTRMEKAFPCAPEWDRSGGFPPKQVMCSSQGNGAAHLEKHHSCFFLLLLATQGRRWWFTSLHPVLLAATLSKKSRKAPLLEMAAQLLRFGVPSLFLGYILIAIIKKKNLFSLCLSLLYIYLYRQIQIYTHIYIHTYTHGLGIRQNHISYKVFLANNQRNKTVYEQSFAL